MQGENRYLIITRPVLSNFLMPSVEKTFKDNTDLDDEEQIAIVEDEDEVSDLSYDRTAIPSNGSRRLFTTSRLLV